MFGAEDMAALVMIVRWAIGLEPSGAGTRFGQKQAEGPRGLRCGQQCEWLRLGRGAGVFQGIQSPGRGWIGYG